MRQRRALYANDRAEVINILRDGTARANAVAQETFTKMKVAMKQNYVDYKNATNVALMSEAKSREKQLYCFEC
jgi:hypothetical protein